MEVEPLSFDNLDDIFNISPVSFSKEQREQIVVFAPSHLGPAVEYLFQQTSAFQHLPAISEFPHGALISAVKSWSRLSYSNRLPRSTQPSPNEIEIIAYKEPITDFEVAWWTAFCQRADKAAQAAGFQPKIAAGLAGALVEMADNLQHSERMQTGLVGYRYAAGEFEFTVADSGIGVLQSLRKCPEFSAVPDHYAALKLALSGKSRFGSGVGHGRGFRQLFSSLADLKGALRFRTGDQAAEISGETPQLQKAMWSQRPNFTGFMVSVLCRS